METYSSVFVFFFTGFGCGWTFSMATHFLGYWILSPRPWEQFLPRDLGG